ncbi:MAG: hypothetical protein C0501_14900 [Isosphaera sp.]|nr:hypothetical protein [Isosphaera sp.]
MPLSRLGLALTALALAAGPAPADEPLRAVIDRELKAAWQREGITPAARSTDSAFLRRVYLDLVGTVPTYDETAAFLGDADPKKREKRVDALLADPRFAKAQADVWDLVLFGRQPANYDSVYRRPGFKDWLRKQFADNVPYDAWVRELLEAEKPGPETFYVQFRGQNEEAAVAVSRIFLGTQIHCAKCHDHPYDVWTQKDFYGMAGFFVRVVVQDGGTKDGVRSFTIGERGTGEVLFSGSAKDQVPGRKGDPVRPKFLGGPVLDEPPAPKDAKEPPAAANAKLPKPAFSRKAKLAAWVASAENPFFAKAAANRVWAQFMGRGVVHPVDDFTKENAASHPDLLKAMAEGLVAHKFDLKWLVREIVTSDGYQLALAGPSKDALPKWFEQARVRPLSAEEIQAAMRAATAFDPDPKNPVKLQNAGDEYFLRYFGSPTNGLGDFQGGLAEHLFLNNAEHVRGFVRRKKGNLTDTLLAMSGSPEKTVERLFLSVLQRPPKPSETELFVKYLAAGGAKPEAAVEDAVWALLNGSEFRFNH